MSLTGKKRRKNLPRGGTGAEERRPLPLRASAMLLSRREVTVSGCRRIIEYGSTRIRISVCEGEIAVEGRGLTVHTYRGDELTVRGWLSGIFFSDSPENSTGENNGKEQR